MSQKPKPKLPAVKYRYRVTENMPTGATHFQRVIAVNSRTKLMFCIDFPINQDEVEFEVPVGKTFYIQAGFRRLVGSAPEYVDKTPLVHATLLDESEADITPTLRCLGPADEDVLPEPATDLPQSPGRLRSRLHLSRPRQTQRLSRFRRHHQSLQHRWLPHHQRRRAALQQQNVSQNPRLWRGIFCLTA